MYTKSVFSNFLAKQNSFADSVKPEFSAKKSLTVSIVSRHEIIKNHTHEASSQVLVNEKGQFQSNEIQNFAFMKYHAAESN